MVVRVPPQSHQSPTAVPPESHRSPTRVPPDCIQSAPECPNVSPDCTKLAPESPARQQRTAEICGFHCFSGGGESGGGGGGNRRYVTDSKSLANFSNEKAIDRIKAESSAIDLSSTSRSSVDRTKDCTKLFILRSSKYKSSLLIVYSIGVNYWRSRLFRSP